MRSLFISHQHGCTTLGARRPGERRHITVADDSVQLTDASSAVFTRAFLASRLTYCDTHTRTAQLRTHHSRGTLNPTQSINQSLPVHV